jgi:hypothetical protein
MKSTSATFACRDRLTLNRSRGEDDCCRRWRIENIARENLNLKIEIIGDIQSQNIECVPGVASPRVPKHPV